MAEDKSENKQDELTQIQDLLEPLNKGVTEEVFSPMMNLFREDLQELGPQFDGEVDLTGPASSEMTFGEEPAPFIESMGLSESEDLASADTLSAEEVTEIPAPSMDDFDFGATSVPDESADLDGFAPDEFAVPVTETESETPLESSASETSGSPILDTEPGAALEDEAAFSLDTETEPLTDGFETGADFGESTDLGDLGGAMELDSLKDGGGSPESFDDILESTSATSDLPDEETDIDQFEMKPEEPIEDTFPAMEEELVPAAAESSADEFSMGSEGEPGGFSDTDDLDYGALGDLSDAKPSPSYDDMTGDDLGMDFGGDSGSSGGDMFAETLQETAATGMPDMSELADMTEQARLNQGIGDEFTDEDLAKIRTQITDYPPGLKKSIVDSIVNDKISSSDQRLLMNMIIDQANIESIADFLEARLGYRPDTAPSRVRKDGVQIIYADELSPEDYAKRRRRMRAFVFLGGAGILAMALTFGGTLLYRKFSIQGQYERGLAELHEAALPGDKERENHRILAEKFFDQALKDSGYNYDLDYMNSYGIAYLKAGFYKEAFIKLYGEIAEKDDYGRDPRSAWNQEGQRAPLIRLAEGSRWPSRDELAAKKFELYLTARDEVKRQVITPGAYIISRLRDDIYHRRTLLSLGRFHSYTARSFVDEKRPENSKYKNDDLAIDYYRLILTLGGKPDDIDALAGIGQIYYNDRQFGAAAREYNKIIDKYPMKVDGHSGLLNTYIEIWKQNSDPRMVIAAHRQIRSLGLEDDLPLFIMTKLAGFYIDLDSDDLRIKYQVDPVDAVSSMDIKDFAVHLLEEVFKKTEDRDGVEISGSQYGEGFYQRGRYLLAQNEAARALRQFQNAHHFDTRHYLAVNAMGEYYKKIRDFNKAKEYFEAAEKTYERDHDNFGMQPEDETLIEGDYGKIIFNLGSLDYLRYAGVSDKESEGFPDTRITPSRGPEDDQTRHRREQLLLAQKDLQDALNADIKDRRAKIDATYWIGWIDYINNDFEGSLEKWETLDSIYNFTDPVLLLAKANSYYYTDQHRAALGNYLKLEADYEKRAMATPSPTADDIRHRELFLTLAAIYNNIGAVYEKEYLELQKRGGSRLARQELEKNALLYYWRAVEASLKVREENEIARANIQLAFKYLPGTPDSKHREPQLDDWIPPLLSLNTKNSRSDH